MISLFLDCLIVILLIGAIGYMMVLNRRLNAFSAMKPELGKVLAGFGEAAEKAEASIRQLKAAGQGAARLDKQDRERLDRALTLRDDLTFLLERGEQLADRLESSLRDARASTSSAPRHAVVDRAGDPRPFTAIRGGAASAAVKIETASETEQVLREALRQARS